MVEERVGAVRIDSRINNLQFRFVVKFQYQYMLCVILIECSNLM